MKKSIIALAVSSAALTSVSAFAAEEPTFDVYGNIQYAYTDQDSGSEFTDNGSTFGFTGETKIDEDLTAFFKYELEAEADEKGDADVSLDQAFVGLQGGFGKVKIGTFDSIYGDAIQDSIDQFENLGFTGAGTTTEGDTIAYFSPNMGGLEVQASAQLKDESNALTAVVKYNLDAVTFAVGYDSIESVDYTDDAETVGFSVSYQAAPSLSLAAKIESTSDTEDVVGLSTRYGYGAGDLYASAQVVSPDAADEYNEYAAGLTYDLASNIYVYGEVGQGGEDEDTTTAVGLYYGF